MYILEMIVFKSDIKIFPVVNGQCFGNFIKNNHEFDQDNIKTFIENRTTLLHVFSTCYHYYLNKLNIFKDYPTDGNKLMKWLFVLYGYRVKSNAHNIISPSLEVSATLYHNEVFVKLYQCHDKANGGDYWGERCIHYE
eukprot:GHVR01031932.1.p1 GENE.GHVR01031932.1~~GHVR01031932.1.p1  ORF type:complete len:138 (-),score=13.25 GHVR01031932.1:88-501(-)